AASACTVVRSHCASGANEMSRLAGRVPVAGPIGAADTGAPTNGAASTRAIAAERQRRSMPGESRKVSSGGALDADVAGDRLELEAHGTAFSFAAAGGRLGQAGPAAEGRDLGFDADPARQADANITGDR